MAIRTGNIATLFSVTTLCGSALLAGCGSTASTTPPVAAQSCTTSPVTITHSATTTNAPQLVFLNTQTYPQAICNDGTAGAYVVRPGVGVAASRWVISLQGGSDCYDNTTCSARAASSPALVSTAPYAANPSIAFTQAGLQSSSSTVNPDFFDATQVQVLYCSSDYWSGTKTGTGTYNANNDATWNFQGHAILAAAIADLKASHSLNSATEILFSGESAGGVGVFVNVNTVANLVPASARFVAEEDAGFANFGVLNFLATGSPPNYTNPSSGNGEGGTVAGALWAGTGDSVCENPATSKSNEQNCYSGAQLLGTTGATILLPMLVVESQEDTVQLNNDGVPQNDINSGIFTTAETGYINYFAANMNAELLTTNSNVSLFSPKALLHTEDSSNSLFDTTYTFPSGSLTPQQAEHNWYTNPCSAQRNQQP